MDRKNDVSHSEVPTIRYASEKATEEFCCICGEPITSRAIEDAERYDDGTWVHQKCAQNQ